VISEIAKGDIGSDDITKVIARLISGAKMDLRHDAVISEAAARYVDEREWTAVEKHKLRGLAKKNAPTAKIARVLKRSVASTATMAAKLGVSLDVDD
jgi:hypothetical protein